MPFLLSRCATMFLLACVGVTPSVSTAAQPTPKPDLLNLPVVDSSPAPIRAVTRGPKFHFFGYYNKFQIDASGRYLLACEVDFEHRMPAADDAVRIGMVDLADGDRWIALTGSRAWSWQQGCMLQWRPGSDTEILFNDREDNRFVCRIFDVKTRRTVRTLPLPIEDVTADGRRALCADFRRMQHIRRVVGYAGVPDPNRDIAAPDDVGVWSMDLETGATKLIVSVAQLARVPYAGATPKDKHYVAHLEWAPDEKRFLMFNRWGSESGGMPTRVFTAAADGSDVRLLSAKGASHWAWLDSRSVLIWTAGGYRVFEDDGSGRPKQTLWKAPNGHQTFIPGTNHQWLMTDTYPMGPQRLQVLYLFHLPTSRAVVLGRFHLPKQYRGEWRCDLHPRVSRDGKLVIIDSPHGGNGRQQYVLDISRIIAGKGLERRVSPGR